MVSSRTRSRNNDATALPNIAASADTPTTAPNHSAPWSCDRNQNARWKKVNPTMPRNTVIAIAPSCTFDECSSVVSAASASCDATTSGLKRVAATNAPQNRIAPYTSVAGAPISVSRMPAGITATAPVIPAIRPSFEFASTSSSSERTVEGTMADFDTA